MDRFRTEARSERVKSDVAHEHYVESEKRLAVKAEVVAELKRTIDKHRRARKEHVEALNMKHRAALRTCQRLESEIVELYSLFQGQGRSAELQGFLELRSPSTTFASPSNSRASTLERAKYGGGSSSATPRGLTVVTGWRSPDPVSRSAGSISSASDLYVPGHLPTDHLVQFEVSRRHGGGDNRRSSAGEPDNPPLRVFVSKRSGGAPDVVQGAYERPRRGYRIIREAGAWVTNPS